MILNLPISSTNEKFNSTKRPEPVKPPITSQSTESVYTEQQNKISPREFMRLTQEWKREKEYAREARNEKKILERELMEEKRISEDYKRENYMKQKEMSELNDRYKKRYETDVLELKEKMERHTNTVLKYSNELDSIIKVQYLVRKYLKNKNKK